MLHHSYHKILLRLREKRGQFSSHFQAVHVPPVLRLFADHAHGLRTARNRSSQLKSLRIKNKGESRGVLGQKLHLAGCTIIVVAGRGGAGEMGVRPYLLGTGTRYQVPILYCKTYYTVNTIILSLESDSADGLETCLEKSSLSILRRATAARAGPFSPRRFSKTRVYWLSILQASE